MKIRWQVTAALFVGLAGVFVYSAGECSDWSRLESCTLETNAFDIAGAVIKTLVGVKSTTPLLLGQDHVMARPRVQDGPP